MSEIIKSSELAEKNLTQPVIQDLKLFLAALDEVEKGVVKLGDQIKKEFKSLDLTKLSDIDKLNKLVIDAAKAEQTLDKVRKQKAKTTKTIAIQTDEEVKARIRYQKVQREQKKLLEAELILENDSIKNKKELTERIKALRVVGQGLDLGSDELEKVNNEIDELNKRLVDNSDEFTKQRLNIGNYKSATEGLTDSFEDQKRKLDILGAALKDAIATGKRGTKEFEQLTKEYNEQKQAIDEVSESLKELEDAQKGTAKGFNLIGTALKAAGIGLIIALLAKISEGFQSSREGSLEASKAFARFTESLKVFVANLVNAIGGVRTIFSAIGKDISIATAAIQLNLAEIKLTFLELNNSVASSGLGKFFGVSVKDTGELKNKILELNKSIAENIQNTDTLEKGWNQIKAAFEDTGETIDKSIDRQLEFLELQQKTEISIQKQTRALAGLGEERQRLQDISDDDTLGFLTRAKAVKEAQDAQIRFAELELTLARTREKLTIDAVKNDLFRSKVATEAQLAAITTGEQLNDFIAKNNNAVKISTENEQAFTEAFVERVEKQQEALSFVRDQEEKNRKTFRDDFEQRLDIVEEFAEQQFALNEKIINDDSATQEERAKALAKNQKIADDLLENSLDLIQEQGKKSIDLRKDLTDEEKELAKAKIDSISVNDILNAQDSLEVQNIIRKADLGEIEEKRLKDTLKIRKDLIETNKELTNSQTESDREFLELEREIALQRKALDSQDEGAFEQLEKDRFELAKQNLEERIELEKEGSKARLELEKELNDLLLEESEKKAAKEAEIEAKRIEDQKELYNTLADIADTFFEEQSKRRLESIKTDLKNVSDAIETEKQLAIAGNEEAGKSLEALKKKEAQLRRQEKEEVRRQQLQQLFISGLRAYGANAEQDPENAAIKTITDSKLLIEALKSLPLNYKGTDRVSDNAIKLFSTGKDDYVTRVHKNERIIGAEESEEINKIPGKITNRMMVEATKEKYLSKKPETEGKNVVVHTQDNKEVVKGLDHVIEAINGKNDHIDLIREVYEMERKNKNVLTKRKMKWRNRRA